MDAKSSKICFVTHTLLLFGIEQTHTLPHTQTHTGCSGSGRGVPNNGKRFNGSQVKEAILWCSQLEIPHDLASFDICEIPNVGKNHTRGSYTNDSRSLNKFLMWPLMGNIA